MEQDAPSGLGRPLKIALGVALLACFIWFVYAIRGILPPFLLAFVLAYTLEPLVDRLEGRGVNRTLSILLIFVLAIGGLAFGLMRLGDKLTSELGELTENFLIQEEAERVLEVHNDGAATVVLSRGWATGVGERPFRIVSPEFFPVEIPPGEKRDLRLRFAPNSQIPVKTRLYLWDQAAGDTLVVWLRGNATAQDEGLEQNFWQKRAPLAQDANGLIVNHRGLDFGAAGPSIIKRVSERVKDVQPMIEPLVGQEFNLPVLVRDHGRDLVQTLLGSTSDLLGGVVSGVTYMVIVPFVTFFFLKEGGRIMHALIELVPNAYFELSLNLIHQINGQIGGYIRGQLLAVGVVAFLGVTGLTLIDMSYPLVIGVLAGVANIIPYLGPLIGIVVASIVALAAGGGMALVFKVIVVFLLIQLVDNVLIQPTVVAKSVDLHPLMVLFAVMVGNQLTGGIVGMLIAVPMTGIIKVSGQTIYRGIKGYRSQ